MKRPRLLSLRRRLVLRALEHARHRERAAARLLSLAEQEFQRLRQSPCPVGLAVLVSFGLDVAQRLLPIALAPQQAVEHARVLQRAGAFVRPDVEIDAAARLARA